MQHTRHLATILYPNNLFMLDHIIRFSVNNKLIIFLFTLGVVAFGSYSLMNIPIGAVPDVTNNQVQVITTSRNLATEDVEKFLTYPVELEMANLPGVKEIRSVSKFGLSVVTIVFEEEMGTYLPRQLIAEKIKSAEENIPAGFGKPFMGPVTTGLGEIYQYIIDVDATHKDQYSITELRTIQDWLVKRQLSGIPGVVEINTWGGFLKQYEVAINPERIRAMNIDISQVYQALRQNNSVMGGGYIEKTNQTFFIRGEGLIGSIADIEQIVVDDRAGTPLLIKDIATVGFGHATRFGAITGNGEGEKVLGQVMMLKDANSKAVIEAVQERVASIQKTLPEGVRINAFLDRSELIAKTTTTIAENLILGCLIVIFVVVLLLGSFRSGLVVASIIPLCLLFALSLMYIFGVDANLMSLGAIDFGIIIDGAVIVVEYIAFKITAEYSTLKGMPKAEKQLRMNEISFMGASKMMRSAIFGQLIIIIVFIPILSLSGVEGKMFTPMALVFCFALIGAMLFCFTYVPVMASLFIKPKAPGRKNISTNLIDFLERQYQPVIHWALTFKRAVLVMASILLIAVTVIFINMGGEFVPTLDEGDFVIQPVLKTGTSLSNTVAATTEMEKILKTFPEVNQVVSRIGAAEVPTDPMSMEESDVIITLKPKSDWVTASSKDGLADAFKEALSIIPGVDYEFTQPIEMRFNELITGVRADLAIKIFGEDLDILYNKALEVERLIQDVQGAADITVEKVAGLPQMTVKYDRQKIAKYGLSIEKLNQLISMGFAGLPAGMVFEGEKNFDLVVRYDKAHRTDLSDIKKASVQLPNGNNLPLSEFANISLTKGPAKISRDNTKRRIVVGVNVRNRDLESVVKDVQTLLEQQLKLPVGYSITYGGQFENLRSARERLMIAVPIALLLIFVLLYFAFNSFKEALIIYSAIPLSAVGGVLLLYMRGMPFSISAGVGFIALFGIAVLNGIVLIEEFKELKKEGMLEMNKRILTGTKNRLRPVLLTAAAAALGFLPMAISTSAGAEVQRPLATVVVGGLISATALTLVVLPILYAIFDSKSVPKMSKVMKPLVILAFICLPMLSKAQEQALTMQQAMQLAERNNTGLSAARNTAQQQQILVGTAYDINKLQVFYGYDQNNISPEGAPINVIGLSQQMKFPTIYGAQHKLLKQQAILGNIGYEINKRELHKSVAKAYTQLVFQQQLTNYYQFLDSLFVQYDYASAKRYKNGGTNYLNRLTAQAKQREVGLLYQQSLSDINTAKMQLQKLIQVDAAWKIAENSIEMIAITPFESLENPYNQWLKGRATLANANLKVEKQLLLPDLHLTVFQGNNHVSRPGGYAGFQAGIGIPLWFGYQKAKIQAAKRQEMIVADETTNDRVLLEAKYDALYNEALKYKQAIAYYQKEGKLLADELKIHASKALETGEIDFLQYAQFLKNAIDIEINYLNNLHQYNIAAIEANYLTF
jgi:cobalt-zinc-cadmium resistance protein CzcA